MVSSNSVFPPELFPAPGLTASPLQPIEGSSVTLSCNTWLPSDRATTQLRYSFFKDGHTLQSGWTSSKFTISAISKEDSGNYWCEAMTASRSVSKHSRRSYIDVESEHLWVGLMGLSPAGRAGHQPDCRLLLIPEGRRHHGSPGLLNASFCRGIISQ